MIRYWPSTVSSSFEHQGSKISRAKYCQVSCGAKLADLGIRRDADVDVVRWYLAPRPFLMLVKHLAHGFLDISSVQYICFWHGCIGVLRLG
jgi:hypothetical protein